MTQDNRTAQPVCSEHCDHRLGTTHMGMWAVHEYTCCRCGRTWSHKYRAVGGWFSTHNEEHGPYEPKVTVTM